MNRLTQELTRLYLVPAAVGAPAPSDDIGGRIGQIASDETVRAMIVAFDHAADWTHAAALFSAAQADLELPAPAVAISGSGYQLWFSLAEAVPAAQAAAFIDGLRRLYLPDLAASRVRLVPERSGGRRPVVQYIPGQDEASGRWSAFIDPGMGDMFVDEPWLAFAPNPDKQADLLRSLASIGAADFRRAASRLENRLLAANAEPASEAAAASVRFADPRRFLEHVMNDTSVDLALRIEAAKALLSCRTTEPSAHGDDVNDRGGR